MKKIFIIMILFLGLLAACSDPDEPTSKKYDPVGLIETKFGEVKEYNPEEGRLTSVMLPNVEGIEIKVDTLNGGET